MQTVHLPFGTVNNIKKTFSGTGQWSILSEYFRNNHASLCLNVREESFRGFLKINSIKPFQPKF